MKITSALRLTLGLCAVAALDCLVEGPGLVKPGVAAASSYGGRVAEPADRGTCIELEDHGGVADGGADHPTDNAEPFKAAAAQALKSGRPICLRAGTYYTGAPWRLDASGAVAETGLVPSLHGAGMNATYIALRDGVSDGVTFEGSLHAGNGVELRDFTILQGGYTGNRYGDLRARCLTVVNAPHIVIRGVRVMQCQVGFQFLDVQEALFENIVASFNDLGMTMSVGPRNASRPNAIQIVNGKFGSNFTNGFEIVNPASVVFLGGSVEGNNPQGHSVDPAHQWGGRLRFSDATLEGTTAATFIGTYFEANAGTADLWYSNEWGPSGLVVEGCTFNRHGIHSVNNVLFETSGGFQQALTLIGNGFRGFGDYAPSASRPYVRVVGSGDRPVVTDLGNVYADPIEAPVFPPASQPSGLTNAAVDPPHPRAGTLYFNTTSKQFRAWDGTVWRDLK